MQLHDFLTKSSKNNYQWFFYKINSCKWSTWFSSWPIIIAYFKAGIKHLKVRPSAEDTRAILYNVNALPRDQISNNLYPSV